MEITLNKQQRLFIFSEQEHTSCLGFDVVFKHCLELARRIKKFNLLKPGVELTPILESEIGTVSQYQQYKNFLSIIGDRKTGTWFDFDTTAKVRQILDQYRKEGGQIRLFYGDRNMGRCWMEENDVVGRMQIPLLIAEGEDGGPGVLDSCIVRIIDADTRVELYRHKNYHLPEIEIRPADASLKSKGYTHGTWVKSRKGEFENHANFLSFGKAAQWVAFMAGECTEVPK